MPMSGIRYTAESVPFSFELPQTFVVKTVEDLQGTYFIVSDTEQKNGFQIYTRNFDEKDVILTEARIKQDIPDMQMKDVHSIMIAQTRGISFISSDTQNREVWFVHKGTLYQITVSSDQEQLVQKILATWQFKI